ncbi:MAG: NCS2 family permease, partial [Desulfuromonadales bacterium]|nr:NCS2 family permease [Desulfuromonadales bacterium]NIS42283.1 NCS2 family permease [Desulfuromonadales bacterium]
MALRLARGERRNDVCALPYGINLFTILFFTFAVMLPAKLGALADGATPDEANRIAWQAGIMACLVCGSVELGGAFFAGFLQRITPRAALLSAIAGIGLVFLAADYYFRAYAHPLVGIPTLVLILILYFGRMRIRIGVPGGLVVLALGTIIAWGQSWAGSGDAVVSSAAPQTDFLGFHLPLPVLGDLAEALPYLLPFLPVALSMGFVSLTGSLMNLESAAAAGDRYPPRPALVINGLGSMATALLGS